VTSVGLCSTSDIITFDQNNHLHLSSAGGKDLSFVTQIRVIWSIESEICMKMLRNLGEKLRAKFPSTTLCYSMVRIACLNECPKICFGHKAIGGNGLTLYPLRRMAVFPKSANKDIVPVYNKLCHLKATNQLI